MTNYDINTEFVKSPGVLNTAGDKIEIKISFKTSDKGTCVVIGSHNGSPFISCISFNKGGVSSQINIVGTLGIASTTYTTDDCMVLKCNTNKYGTCTVIATIPIEYVIFSN